MKQQLEQAQKAIRDAERVEIQEPRRRRKRWRTSSACRRTPLLALGPPTT